MPNICALHSVISQTKAKAMLGLRDIKAGLIRFQPPVSGPTHIPGLQNNKQFGQCTLSIPVRSKEVFFFSHPVLITFLFSAQIVVLVTLLCAMVSPVIAIPTGSGMIARQDDLPDPNFATRTKAVTTKPPRPTPTYCGPNKRQEGDATALKIVPVCD